jgi:small multidrug resistance pump
MLKYLYLLGAILAEVTATSFLKQSNGFARLAPTAIMIFGYLVSFFFLSLTLKSLPTGIAYAIWSGVGIVLISAVAWIFQGQKLDFAAIAGMALIISGVAVINFLSKTTGQ